MARPEAEFRRSGFRNASPRAAKVWLRETELLNLCFKDLHHHPCDPGSPSTPKAPRKPTQPDFIPQQQQDRGSRGIP